MCFRRFVHYFAIQSEKQKCQKFDSQAMELEVKEREAKRPMVDLSHSHAEPLVDHHENKSVSKKPKIDHAPPKNPAPTTLEEALNSSWESEFEKLKGNTALFEEILQILQHPYQERHMNEETTRRNFQYKCTIIAQSIRHMKNEHDLSPLLLLNSAAHVLKATNRGVWESMVHQRILLSHQSFRSWLKKSCARAVLHEQYPVCVGFDGLVFSYESFSRDAITLYEKRISNISLEEAKSLSEKMYQPAPPLDSKEVLATLEFNFVVDWFVSQSFVRKRVDSPIKELDEKFDSTSIHALIMDKNASAKDDVEFVKNEIEKKLEKHPFIISYTDLGLLMVLWNVLKPNLTTPPKWLLGPGLWHWKLHIMRAFWSIHPITSECSKNPADDDFFEFGNQHVIVMTHSLIRHFASTEKYQTDEQRRSIAAALIDRSRSSASPAMDLEDSYFLWTIMIGIPYCETVRCIRERDSNNLWRLWQYWLPFFVVAGKTNYVRLTILVMYYKKWLSPEMWNIYWNEAIIRTTHSTFPIPMDLYNEKVYSSLLQLSHDLYLHSFLPVE